MVTSSEEKSSTIEKSGRKRKSSKKKSRGSSGIEEKGAKKKSELCKIEKLRGTSPVTTKTTRGVRYKQLNLKGQNKRNVCRPGAKKPEE